MRDGVPSDGCETNLEWDRGRGDLVLVVSGAADLGPAPGSGLVLNLGQLGLVVEEEERRPVLSAVRLC